MAFIIVEGVDKSGKSTVAEHYRKKGFDVMHFSAPDKKYYAPGYSGPSYLEDIMELLVSLSGKDVFFDRSWWAEAFVWPQVYGRTPLITPVDIEMIKEIEDQNNPIRILMYDRDPRAHWQRCVDNKEPLDLYQFKLANELYDSMAEQHGFQKIDLPLFLDREGKRDRAEETALDSERRGDRPAPSTNQSDGQDGKVRNSEERSNKSASVVPMTPEQQRLAKANAINEILSKPIIKNRGEHFCDIENKIRQFLNDELADLLGTKKIEDVGLSKDEIFFIKTLFSKAGTRK